MNQQIPAAPGQLRRWPMIALGAGAAIAGAMATAWLAAPGPPARTDCGCASDETLRREVAEHRVQLEQLRFAVQVAGVTGPVTQPGSMAQPGSGVAPPNTPRGQAEVPFRASAVERPGDAAPLPPAQGGRRRGYDRFETPTSAVTVRYSAAGELVVKNTDPALAGQTIVVHGFSEEAAPDPIQVVVPPAEPR
jgi:hypothetical protein